MRHRVSGKQLSRSTSHRKALRRNMAASLIQHGAIRTTQAKAKELRRFVEKLITTAKVGTLHARRQVIARLRDRLMADDKGDLLDKTVVQKLFDEVAPRYANRAGGYTRIIHVSDRRIGDAGRQVLLQLVEEKPSKAEESRKSSRRRRRAAKRHQAAAGQVAQGAPAAATAQAGQPADQAPAEEQKPGEQKE